MKGKYNMNTKQNLFTEKIRKQSKEDQKKQLQEQADKVVELVEKSLLSIVSKAEKEWGSGTGTIKKSWVWEQIQAQQQKLTEYISAGLISKDMIDDLIETAVDELNELKKKNQKAAEAVTPPEEREAAAVAAALQVQKIQTE